MTERDGTWNRHILEHRQHISYEQFKEKIARDRGKVPCQIAECAPMVMVG
jgi:FPC/CPF motif-containing protein YcgG